MFFIQNSIKYVSKSIIYILLTMRFMIHTDGPRDSKSLPDQGTLKNIKTKFYNSDYQWFNKSSQKAWRKQLERAIQI